MNYFKNIVERRLFRLLLMLVFGKYAASLSISHWDLEGANKTCDWRANCSLLKNSKNSRIADIVDWKDRNCMCDKQCSRYGDCCTDSPHFDVDEQRRGSATFSCVTLKQFGGIYMQTSCPPRWGDMAVRSACEKASDNQKDPMAGVPVTSNNTGITYRNLYCSMCHDDHYDLHVWHPHIECDQIPFNLTVQTVSNMLDFDKTKKSWGFRLDNKFYTCVVDPVIPETAVHIIRRCPSGVVKTCAVNWTNIEVRSRCEAYTSLVYDSDATFRNPHCAMCNNVALQHLQCAQILFRFSNTRDFSPIAFSVLFDLSAKQVGMVEPCAEDQLYDPFFKRCRSIITELKANKHYYLVDNSAKLTNSTIIFVPKENNTDLEPCSKFILEREEFSLENRSVYVPQYKKRFEEGDFMITDDGKLEICIGALGIKLVDKFGVYMGYVTYAGLGISIIFLILHLTAFSLVSELRNLSGKNLASLCISLLVAYTTFMAGQVLEGIPCFVIAVITFYAFLASFMWMLTMAFDVWRTLRLATAELRVSAGKQWRKFFIYSIWSWTAPAVIVGGAIWVELTPEIPKDWRPEFAVYSCWFGQSKPLLAFFAAPLAIIMALNITFFASSAHMIYSTTSTTKFTASASTQRDFRLYVRLAVVMGLTWTMGLIAGTLDIEVLWYVFIALNTLQGLFIFLAFTCTDKVIRGLAVRQNDDKPLRPPSFSWSTDSTRRSHMGSDQATTDTLY